MVAGDYLDTGIKHYLEFLGNKKNKGKILNNNFSEWMKNSGRCRLG